MTDIIASYVITGGSEKSRKYVVDEILYYNMLYLYNSFTLEDKSVIVFYKSCDNPISHKKLKKIVKKRLEEKKNMSYQKFLDMWKKGLNCNIYVNPTAVIVC